MPVGYTPLRSVQELGFDSLCNLTPMRRLYPLPVRQASALPTASSRPHLAVSAVAAQLTLPLAGCVEDFHLQESAPCRAHKGNAATRLRASGSSRRQRSRFRKMNRGSSSIDEEEARSHTSSTHCSLSPYASAMEGAPSNAATLQSSEASRQLRRS